ncbi:MAG: hypothetical protein ACLGPM_06100 [Acidobacteriota bacterium]
MIGPPAIAVLLYVGFSDVKPAVTGVSLAAQHDPKHISGIYFTRSGRILRALAQRTPGTFWIDGYPMVLSSQTRICWHRASLQFGATLTPNGQPATKPKASVACYEMDPHGWQGSAWLQYEGTEDAGANIAATRIDVWSQDSGAVNEPRKGEPLGSARHAPCSPGAMHELRYPHERPISVVCNAAVRDYIQRLLESSLKAPSSTGAARPEVNEDVKVYVVKPFRVGRNYDFEAVDGFLGGIDMYGWTFYRHPSAGTIVQQIVLRHDGTVLVPDTVLVHLKNEAECAALLSYSLATVHQQIIKHLERVQDYHPDGWSLSNKKNGSDNVKYSGRFMRRLNQKVLRLGIRRMYLAGYDIREAPFAWSVAAGKSIPEDTLRPSNSFPWYATYAAEYINRYYSDVNYSKLKRGEAEYGQFLQELRKADPGAFAPEKR